MALDSTVSAKCKKLLRVSIRVCSLHALQICRACRRYIQRGYSNETEDAKWLVERQTLEDFASAVVSHSSMSIRSILEMIHSIVVPQKRIGLRLQGPGIFRLLADVMHVSSALSTSSKGPSNVLHCLTFAQLLRAGTDKCGAFQACSQNCEKRLSARSCLSAWNNPAPNAQIFMKLDI